MVRTRVGYAGGSLPHPTYENLGDHTETLQIEFDPAQISYARLLEIFWEEHDPCYRPSGVQYQNMVFCHDPEQKRLAEEGKARLESRGKKVLTAIRPAGKFWVAEDYHQKYRLRCTEEVMREFEALYPDAGAFRDSTAAARVNGYLAGHGSPEQLEAELDRLGVSDAAKKALRRAVR